MRPAVERQPGAAVHVPIDTADEDLAVGNGRLPVRIEPVGEARCALLEDQGAPGRAERARPSPTLERHPQRQVERARIGDRDPVAGAVQRDGGAKAARRRPAGAAQRAVVAGARGIGGRVARALVEGVGADEPRGGGWWWWWWWRWRGRRGRRRRRRRRWRWRWRWRWRGWPWLATRGLTQDIAETPSSDSPAGAGSGDAEVELRIVGGQYGGVGPRAQVVLCTVEPDEREDPAPRAPAQGLQLSGIPELDDDEADGTRPCEPERRRERRGREHAPAVPSLQRAAS